MLNISTFLLVTFDEFSLALEKDDSVGLVTSHVRVLARFIPLPGQRGLIWVVKFRVNLHMILATVKAAYLIQVLVLTAIHLHLPEIVVKINAQMLFF